MLTEQREKRFRQVISERMQDVVVLENIHDPHNALAAIRNCDAFGIQTSHFIFEKEKEFNPGKLGKLTSASANKWVDSVCWKTTKECYEALRKDGFRIYATIIDPKAKPLDQVRFVPKSAIVFGNEGFGITEDARDLADELVYIPMSGFVDSINLSVSVGVVLYELSCQRRGKKGFLLQEERQDELYKRWVGDDMKKKYRL